MYKFHTEDLVKLQPSLADLIFIFVLVQEFEIQKTKIENSIYFCIQNVVRFSLSFTTWVYCLFFGVCESWQTFLFHFDYDNLTANAINIISTSTNCQRHQAISTLQNLLELFTSNPENSFLPITSNKLDELQTSAYTAKLQIQEIYYERLTNQFQRIFQEFENFSENNNWSSNVNDVEYKLNLFKETFTYLNDYEAIVVTKAVDNYGELQDILPNFYKNEDSVDNKIAVGKIIKFLLEEPQNVNGKLKDSVRNKTLDQHLLYEGTLPLACITGMVQFFYEHENYDKVNLPRETNLAEMNTQILTQILLQNSILKHFKSFDFEDELQLNYGDDMNENLKSFEIPIDVHTSLGNVFITSVLNFIEFFSDHLSFGLLTEKLVDLILAINLHGSRDILSVIGIACKQNARFVSRNSNSTDGNSCASTPELSRRKLPVSKDKDTKISEEIFTKVFSEKLMARINDLKTNQPLNSYLPLKLLIDIYQLKSNQNFLGNNDFSVLLRIAERNIGDLSYDNYLRKLFSQLLINLIKFQIVTKDKIESMLDPFDFTGLRMILEVDAGEDVVSGELLREIEEAKL